MTISSAAAESLVCGGWPYRHRRAPHRDPWNARGQDGYTRLHYIGLTTASALYRNLPYRSVEDFKPNRLVTAVAMTLVAKGTS